MSNNRLALVSTQAELTLLRPPLHTENPPIDVIATYKDRTDALVHAIRWAGYTDSEIADAMKISTSQMSKILSPNTAAHFPTDRYHEFNQLVGNTIITVYDAYVEGLEVRPLETHLEKENRELRDKLNKQDEQMEVIKSFLKEIKQGA